ncbi:MAG: biotin transporter BioY [Shinella sp.]|nr:biotin transporter BioY [Shinella sp.]
MSGLENAIRNALARSERSDPEARARIYQSARNALEAGLRKQEINDPEAIAAQRHRLEVTIRQIEAEERATLQAEIGPQETDAGAQSSHAGGDLSISADPDSRIGVVHPEAAPAGNDIGGVRPHREDGFAAEPPDRQRRSETSPQAAEPASDFRPERVAKARRRRGRLFSFLLVLATLVAAIGTAAWWVTSSGLLLSPAERDTSVANPPPTVSDEDFSGEDPVKRALETQSRFSSDWREVFTPDDTGGLSAGSEGRFEPVTTGEGPAVRIVSGAPEREGAVLISVAPDILQEMSGRTSTVALSVQSSNRQPVHVSVECDFSTLGSCGRHRFTVSERTDLLFQVEFDRSLSPNAAGRLLVNSDVAGGGGSVDLFAVRILPGE